MGTFRLTRLVLPDTLHELGAHRKIGFRPDHCVTTRMKDAHPSEPTEFSIVGSLISHLNPDMRIISFKKAESPARNQSRWHPPPLVLILLGIDLLLGLAYGLNFLAGHPFHSVNALVDLDGEANLPSWYSSIQLFGIAFFFGAFAFIQYRASRARSWLLLALPVLFLVLSLDEIAQIHEWLGQQCDILLPGGTRKGTFFESTGIWMFLLGGPLLVLFGTLGWGLRSQFAFAPRVLPLFAAGVLLFMVGAAGIEAVSNVAENDTPVLTILIIAEELLEMFGATVIFWSAYELLAEKGFVVGWREPPLPGSGNGEGGRKLTASQKVPARIGPLRNSSGTTGSPGVIAAFGDDAKVEPLSFERLSDGSSQRQGVQCWECPAGLT